MKGLPSEFLGALFGAWIGVATRIWDRPWYEIVVFVLTIALIALFLSVVTVPYAREIRWTAGVVLTLLALLSGLTFAFFPGFEILMPEQLVFYYVLLIVWLTIGLIGIRLETKIEDISNRLLSKSSREK